ncbi:MAG: phosphoenolpyruvate-protein kinase [uncultured bacterium]|nr:MAG: phosphoenolpyruvate-protein kinase [uncultured bacterium]
MGKKWVTIRTLDIGGDKYLPYLNLPDEENPSLGWRSIRISLDREDLFRIQLRALLRASAFGNVKLLFPMISSVEEIRKVKEIVRGVKAELKASGYAFDDKIQLGIMIEVPAAVTMADVLIKEVQFFSIGTNDLIQYTLAVDRNNAKVAKLFDPFHPAVIRNIHHVIMIGHSAKKSVSICGEIGSNPLVVPLLVGMGVDMLSMNPSTITKIKSLVCKIGIQDAKVLLKKVLLMDSSVLIKKTVTDFFVTYQLTEYLK